MLHVFLTLINYVNFVQFNKTKICCFVFVEFFRVSDTKAILSSDNLSWVLKSSLVYFRFQIYSLNHNILYLTLSNSSCTQTLELLLFIVGDQQS